MNSTTTIKEEFFKVPKLLADGGNWVTYRDRLRWALSARGLLEYIDEDIPEPTVTSPETLNTASTPALGTETEGGSPGNAATGAAAQAAPAILSRGYEIRVEKWRMAQATVKQCIASTIPDSVFNRIKSKNTAKAVWDALAEIFETRSTMVAIDLRLKLQNVKCGDGQDVRAHFDKLADMRERLASYGVDLEDHEYASILVGSLPSTYDPTLSSILASAKLSKTPLDPDVVTSLITDDFDRRELAKKKGKGRNDDAAYYAGSGKGGGKGGKGDKVCHNCQKKGHFKADCWAKGGGKEGQGPKGKKGGGSKKEEVNAAEAEEEDGVWAIMDDELDVKDWDIDSSESTDWSLLSENSEEEFEDVPESIHIPDTDQLDAERLRSIMLSRNVAYASVAQIPTDGDSMPDLQSVSGNSLDSDNLSYLTSETPDDEGSMPDLESVARTSDNGGSVCEEDVEVEGEAERTTFASAALIGTVESRKAESDLYDSGASRHMTPFKHRLMNFTKISSRPITAADKRVFHATGKGDLRIRIPNSTTTTTILLKDVLYAPDMGVTIISISRIAAAGYSTLFRQGA